MTTAATPSQPAWQAEVTRKTRSFPLTKKRPEDQAETEETTEGEPDVTFLKLRDYFVAVFRPEGERICFRVSCRRGRPVSVSDPRDRLYDGTAGTTGIRGTLPPARPIPPRSLTLTGFQTELARFIGVERAAEIVQTVRSIFSSRPLDIAGRRVTMDRRTIARSMTAVEGTTLPGRPS